MTTTNHSAALRWSLSAGLLRPDVSQFWREKRSLKRLIPTGERRREEKSREPAGEKERGEADDENGEGVITASAVAMRRFYERFYECFSERFSPALARCRLAAAVCVMLLIGMLLRSMVGVTSTGFSLPSMPRAAHAGDSAAGNPSAREGQI